jgi:hypothetical protein
MQTLLELALEYGIGGKKPLAFAKVDAGNLDELHAAVEIFGGVLLGVDLETAQQSQTDNGRWDYKKSGSGAATPSCAADTSMTPLTRRNVRVS